MNWRKQTAFESSLHRVPAVSKLLHLAIEKMFGMDTFFCDPYSAWQKGAVENLNKAARVFIPKGTDLKSITELKLAEIENIINARPMDCLGKFSPDQAWAQELQKIGVLLH